MKIITISGIIATWEMENESNVTPATLKKSLDDANGEDVRIDINSPGGSVFAGLEMFSAIRNYSGKTETRIVSMAASMGSIVALAGNKRTAERTASYMIHNASSFAWGDHRAMAKAARELEAVSGHLSNIYTDRAGVDNADVRAKMNEETWLYGEELDDFGFEIVEPADPVDIATAKFESLARYNNFKASIKPEEFAADFEKVAASIAGPKIKPVTNTTKISNSTPKIEGKINNEEKIMDFNKLKNEHPDIFAQAVQQGVDQERERVEAHAEWVDVAPKEVMAAIIAGDDFTVKHSSKYAKAQLVKTDVQDRLDDDETTPVVVSASEDDTEAEIEAYGSALSKGMRGKKK